MSLTTPFQETYQELLDSNDELQSFRQSAWECFEKMGLPHSKDEAFQHINLRELAKAPYKGASLENINTKLIEEAVKPYSNMPHMVFYNGHFTPRFSNLEKVSDRIIIKPLGEAFLSYSVFLKNLFQKWVLHEKNPLVLLSIALHSQGLFIYVPGNHVEPTPIHIIEVSDGEQNQVSAPLVITSCGRNSQLDLITVSQNNAKNNQISLPAFHFNLEEHSILRQTHYPQAPNEMRLEAMRASLKKDSHYKCVAFIKETQKIRSDYKVRLNDVRAQAEVCMLSLLRKKQQAHTYILVEHKAPECFSRQLVKNLFDDESMGSFEGKIYVDSIAQQTNAYQLNQNCLLSEGAKCYSKPNLEIFADDVKASHGSTTGQIDSEHLFYLQSRGLSKKEAQKLLLQAFCRDVLSYSSHKDIKKIIQSDLSNYFELS
ncbi:MAG: hypothetical protein S4CHLAM6_12120 [Chlamydiae bacterium]|nr:hypothetical protein [Chlamydiota bacterium]